VLRHRLVMLSIAIDRRAAARYSITLNTIDQTLFDAFGQRQIATIYGPLTQYHVVMEVDPASHKDPLSLTRFT
jgi:multidrug efflux pump subunit AcrB